MYSTCIFLLFVVYQSFSIGNFLGGEGAKKIWGWWNSQNRGRLWEGIVPPSTVYVGS